jgi:vacuolar-type H+-ATPase subunit I/STV1
MSVVGLCIAGAGALACSSPRERARADSVQAIVTQQGRLMNTLTAQRDSVSELLGDADDFIGHIDSSISRVKGLRPARASKNSESALEEQVRQRKDMLRRVDALVARAQATAKEVAALKDREKQLRSENGELKDSLSAAAQRIAMEAQLITELRGTIDQQAASIADLQAKLDDFDKRLTTERANAARAYYVIGTESDLLRKGVIVKEGGANLLVKRVGRTVVPARELNAEAFTLIDSRDVHAITVPDTAKWYRIVSRQSLDDVKVDARDGTSFKGALEIQDPAKFWAGSRYLIIVQR